MTYDQILVFHKIVSEGSFKAASQSLHRTQPAVSFAIKKLEEELGVELFDRTSYRPSLTIYGQAFFEHSQKVVQGMTELEGLAQSFNKEEEIEVKVAVDGISPLPELLKIFKQFQGNYPNTRLNLGLEILSASEKRVLEKDAQMGITHFISSPKDLEIIPIVKVNLMPVISTALFEEKNIKRQSDLYSIDQIVLADPAGVNGASFGILPKGRQ